MFNNDILNETNESFYKFIMYYRLHFFSYTFWNGQYNIIQGTG